MVKASRFMLLLVSIGWAILLFALYMLCNAILDPAHAARDIVANVIGVTIFEFLTPMVTYGLRHEIIYNDMSVVVSNRFRKKVKEYKVDDIEFCESNLTADATQISVRIRFSDGTNILLQKALYSGVEDFAKYLKVNVPCFTETRPYLKNT